MDLTFSFNISSSSLIHLVFRTFVSFSVRSLELISYFFVFFENNELLIVSCLKRSEESFDRHPLHSFCTQSRFDVIYRAIHNMYMSRYPGATRMRRRRRSRFCSGWRRITFAALLARKTFTSLSRIIWRVGKYWDTNEDDGGGGWKLYIVFNFLRFSLPFETRYQRR